MKHTLYVYTVAVRRDQVPGWNHQPEDMREHLERVLGGTIGHYRPQVEFAGEVEE